MEKVWVGVGFVYCCSGCVGSMSGISILRFFIYRVDLDIVLVYIIFYIF